MSTRKDELLIKSFALPAAAGTVQSEAFDVFTSNTPNDIYDIHAQFQVSVPALTAAQLPDSTSLTVKMQSSDDPAFGEGNVSEFAVGTIAGGSTAYGGGTFTFKPTEKPQRYWRAAITAAGTITTMAALKGELTLVF